MLICITCERKVERRNSEGVCVQCELKQNAKEDISQIPISLPEGLIAAWNCKAAYLNKALGRRYFYIPENQSSNIIDDIEYKIIIREV